MKSMLRADTSNGTSSLFKELIVLAIYIGVFISLIFLGKLQQEVFRKSSLESIKKIQQDDSESTIGFFRFIYFLGDTRCYMIFQMMLFNLASRHTSFYFNFLLSLCIFVSSLLKLIFQDGRPFMFSYKIFPFICELSFGNPSEVMMNAVSFTTAAALHIITNLRNQKNEISDKQKLILAGGVVLTLTMLILFSLEGLYNGTHTLDEVFFGAELGFFLALFG